MLNQGWFEREDDHNFHRSGGFQNRYETSLTKLFCHSEQGPSLAVTPSIVAEVTEVKLSLNDDPDNGSCLIEPPRFRGYEDFSVFIPRLLPPDEATFSSIRSGGDREDYYQSVSLLADLDLAAIAAHFAIQLEQGGWICRDQGQGESLIWSFWTFQTVENRNGQATFLARKKLETSSQYLLDLLLELA
ncbi:hypothetical protein H6F67_01515 [Microcoleus sp. FACHB-1515]|uniref:hypothetical protein n=1 Tax=Cyanophyceae TaxID=3028117 RepID=UPI001683E18B|nr:hypothetical protein [Microcoleus sp. FACHB-1515]MBD2088546.1 hypothetical protein [Microcoleus sp. FACHB-1515]